MKRTAGAIGYVCTIVCCCAITAMAGIVSLPAPAGAAPLPKVQQSLKSIDLSRVPTVEELMAAGQLGGQLYPTAEVEISDDAGGNPADKVSRGRILRNRSMNVSFGTAMEQWNRHEYPAAVLLLREHVEQFPDSPWSAEALLHLGCDAQYNGRYGEAQQHFERLISSLRGNGHYGARRLLQKARLRLGVLKVYQNNFEEAARHFKELRASSDDWRERSYASHWLLRLGRYSSDQISMLTCGSRALAYILDQRGNTPASREVAQLTPDTRSGHSVQDLATLAAGYGLELAGLRVEAGDLGKLPLPAIVHLARREQGDSGHYWIIRAVENDTVHLYDPQGGIAFRQSIDQFGREWDGVVLAFSGSGASLPGKRLTSVEMEQLHGGCCGVPRPENRLGNPGRGKKNPCGSPAWEVNMINMNLYANDIPLWYSPPIGPPVEISLSYNSQSAIAIYEPFGNKWQFNYASYLVQDTGGRVTVFMPDGRRDTYGTYTPISVVYSGSGNLGFPVVPQPDVYPKTYSPAPYQVFNTLTQFSSTRYELKFPDGTVYVYDRPAGTGSLQQLLVEIRDRYNQKLTFGYDSAVRLSSITDAVGQRTVLSYNADGLVTRVNDPFGRSAYFTYDTAGNLSGITDMGGYSASFTYDTDVFLTSVTTPRGTTRFQVEPAVDIDNGSVAYPGPGEPMWANYRITVTNPEGKREEYYYNGYSGYAWYVSPRDYIQNVPGVSGNLNDAAKTIFDLTRPSAETGEISRITPPEGSPFTFFSYDSWGNVSEISISDESTWRFIYNDQGRVTEIQPARKVAGETEKGVTYLAYAANGIDPVSITDDLGTVTAEYNGNRDVVALKDRMNRTTSFTYNSYGQTLTRTDPDGVVTTYVYGSDQRLQQAKRAGVTIAAYTYDAIGRVRTATDSAGVTATYDYNNLDKIQRVTWPDGKYDSIVYSGCCPHQIDSITDRGGRTFKYSYDQLGRPVEEVNPEGGTTRYGYDANGNLTRLTDPNGNVTRFVYDLNDRLTKKIYHDDTIVTYAYHTNGFLASRTGGRGATATYSYDRNRNLLGIAYSDSTPAVALVYDTSDRLVNVQDGSGTTIFSYDPESRVTGIDGPWEADAIGMQYDAAGRRTAITVQGGQALAYGYDQQGRLATVGSGLGSTYTYGYSGSSPLIQTLTRPDGSITSYQYDTVGRLTGLTTRAPQSAGGAIIASVSASFDSHDRRASETASGYAVGSPSAGATYYNYNRLNQTLGSQSPNAAFFHDADGNMTGGLTPDAYPFTSTYDAENRLASIQYTDGNKSVQRREYRYNAWGFVAEERKVTDGSQTALTRFVSLGPLLLQERNGLTNGTTREYWWGRGFKGGAGGLLGLYAGGQLYSYLYDGRRNVAALLDSGRNIAAAYVYDSFGRPVSRIGSLVQPFRFGTKPYDEGTGLQNYGYRFYSVPVGRWLTRDPLEEFGGLNLYSFVGNDPLNNYDPFGLESFDDVNDRRNETREAVDDFGEVLDDIAKDKNPKNFKELGRKKLDDFVKKNTGAANEYKRLQEENKKNRESAKGLFEKLKDLWRRAGCALAGSGS